MIERIGDPVCFDGFKQEDIFAVRVLSLLGAYGCKYPFASFYRQLDENGEITAVLSSLDGNVTVSALKGRADEEELRSFVLALGYNSALCDKTLNISESFSFGNVMESKRQIEIIADRAELNRYPNLFDLYNFLDGGIGGFDAWYTDLNHRIRHGFARAYSLEIGGETVSSALLSSVYGDKAVLSGVRTDERYRGNGYASALVSAVCCDFCGKVYLMRENGKNEDFYKRLGFENTGIWRMYK